ncbi:MAG: hypothetical protein QME77_04565 [bacterium]|nr:hypothetical protein [bacterium]
MSASNGPGIHHYAWTRGLAAVVDAPAHRTAAVFGPGGWEQGQPRTVLPAGAPPGAETAHLALPAWLAEQIAGLQFSAGGLHTAFVRLNLLLERLRSQQSDAAVLVLGEKPSVYVVTGGQVAQCGEGTAPPGEASGWIVVFSGKVRVPVEEPRAAVAAPPGAADETYFVPAGVRNAMSEEVAAGILEVAGPAGHAVPGLLDGSRTIGAVAATAGLTTAQARAVVGVLMAQRIAFRYVGRSRPAPRPGSGTCANAPDGL